MKETIPDKKWNPGHARGRRGRMAALIAAVAICACTAVRLEAVVIDDFEGPVKFEEGGGGTNEFIWGLTNGQLVVYTNATGPEQRYDNVYWPAPPLPEGNLEGRRTLELRTDLNHTSADDLFLLLMYGGDTGGADSCYGVFIDRNEVALMKYRDYSGFTTFYWDTLATTNENVTVKLAFTRTNNSLAITVKVVDKGNQRATLYERTFVDGPGQDGPVVPPDPHGLGYFTPDEGAPFTNFTYAAAGCWQMIFTTHPPLEMLLDNLEYDVYYPPHLEIAPATNGVALDWRLPLEEHIVVEADQLTGPWCLCLEPCTRTGDAFCLTMPCQSPQKFFKLTPGRLFIDDFSRPLPSYMEFARDAGEEWFVTNGVLRLQSAVDGLLLAPLGTNAAAIHEDFFTSADILDWTTSGNSWGVFSIYGRFVAISDTAGYGYGGRVKLNYDGTGGVRLSIFHGWEFVLGPTFDMGTNPPPYRLEFSGVGNPVCELRFRVLNLTTKKLIAEQTLSSTKHANGCPAIWIDKRKEAGDTFAITVDNYFVSGAKP